VVVAVARETRLIVGQAVVTHRSQAELQKLVDELPQAARCCTDGFTNYAELIWPQPSEHVISHLKQEIYTIEGVNADLRTYLGRLARRRRCFSRSIKALSKALGLFTWYYNRRQRLINANPRFKSHLYLVF
jgi:IS1 family transposase